MGLISGRGRRGRGGFGMGHLLLLIIGVSWLSFSSVEGVKCYACTGEDNCMTGDKECPGSIGCYKEFAEVDGKKMIYKSCGGSLQKEGCWEGEVKKMAKEFQGGMCFCKGDFCNSGGASADGGAGSAGGGNSTTKKYSPSLMILLAASTLTALVTKFGVLRGGI